MKKLPLFFAVLLFTAATAVNACSSNSSPQTGNQVPADGGRYTNISAAQLNSMLSNKDFLLVNVHIPYEGEIGQTDLFIPFDKIADNAGQLPTDKNARIVLYCRSGSMSAEAAGTMADSGYTNLYNLIGGMNDWEAQGYQLLQKPQQN